MRLVFDTNVLFAAHISRGKCAILYELALATETIVTSLPILDELQEKLRLKAISFIAKLRSIIEDV